jgi:outer membrane protein OmpA-like peptidoglycan-associated protein/tetratricopeptide (TPR) repeat protein
MNKYTFILLVGLFCCNSCFAQYNKNEVKPKAKKHFNEAVVAMQMGDKEAAIKELNKAIQEDKTYCDAYVLLGDLQNKNGATDEAISTYKKAMAIDSVYCFKRYRTIAEIKSSEKKFDEAIKYYQQYCLFSKVSENEKTEIKRKIESCKFTDEAIKNPVPFHPKPLGSGVNSPLPDYYPYLSVDGENLIFVRLENRNEDFYQSKKINGKWSEAEKMPAPINTNYNEGGITFSPDKNEMYFVRCGDKINGDGSCDIYACYKEGKGWSKPSNQGFNTAGFESMPSFSSDGKTLYFVAANKIGLGGMDIYSTEKTESGWSEPKNLGNAINTSGNEQFPFIHPDNQTLYFVSDGKAGMGRSDIFYSRRLPNGTWSEAVNIGYPINTEGDERGIFITADGSNAIISRDNNGDGNYNLYEFELYGKAQPTRVTYVKGIITDAKTHQPIYADFQLIDLKSGKIITQSASNEADGKYLVCIPSGKDYALNVSNKKYLFYSENFSLKDKIDSIPFEKNVELQAIEVGKSVVLKNIFFETDKFDLKPESKVELKKLYAFLVQNPTVKILIAGHTDNSGNPKHNLELSDNRAKSVYDYLIMNKIDASRLQYKGYGETHPLIANDTPENKALNRRTEFVITEK